MAEATDLERLIATMEVRMTSWEKELKRAAKIYDREARTIEKRQKDLTARLKEGTSRLGQMLVPSLGGIAAALSTREIIAYADAWTEAGNKIVAAGTAVEEQGTRLRELADLAVATRSAFEPTVNTFARLERSTQGLGLSQAQLLRYTKTINESFIVGGAAASEQAAGILQLSQAIASGILGGDELRSVRENAPLIARAIADVMGVSIGQLKQLGADGKITVDIILKALEKLGPSVDKLFGKTTSTVGRALTNLETRFTEFVGGLSEAGVTGEIAAGINLVANNLDKLAAAAAIAAAALAPAGLAAAYGLAARAAGALTAVILANPLGAVAAALSAAGVAIYLYAKNQSGAEKAQAAFNKALEVGRDLEAQVREGRVSLTKATAENAVTTLEAARAEKERALALLRAQAADLAALKQQQKGANPQTGLEEALALKQIGKLEDEIRAADESLGKLKKNMGATVGAKVETPTIVPAKTKSDPWSSAVRSIEKQTAALAAQGGVTHRTTYELEKAEQASKLLSAAQAAGKKETPALTAEIDRLADAYARAAANNQVEKAFASSDERLRALQQEADALGLTEVQADALRFKQYLLNEAMDAGVEITPQLEARIEAAGEAYGRAAQRIEDARQAIQNQIDIADSARDGLVNIGLAGVHGFGAMKEAAADALAQIAQLILKLYVMKPLVEGLLGASGTPFSGGLGSMFAGFFAGGGSIPAGQWGIVGEKGPEPVKATGSGIKVLPNSALRPVSVPKLAAPVPLAAPAAGQLVVNIDATGADAAGLRRVEASIQKLHQSFDARAVNAVVSARRRGGTLGGSLKS